MPRGVRAGLAVLVLLALAPSPAAGQGSGDIGADPAGRQSEIARELSRLGDDIDELTVEEQAVIARFDAARRAEEQLAAEVARLDGEITATAATLHRARGAVTAALARLEDAQARLDDVRARLAAARDDLQRSAFASYVGHGQLGLVGDLVTQRREAMELVVAIRYAERAGEVRQERIDRMTAERALVVRLEEEAGRAADEAAARRADVEAQEEALRRAREEQEAARRQAEAEAAAQAALADQVQAAKAAAQRRLASLQQESARIAALLRERAEQERQAREAAARRAEEARQAAARATTTVPKPAGAAKPPASTARPAAPATTARPPAPATTARPATPAATAPPTTAAPAPTPAPTAAPPTTAKPAPTTAPTTAPPASTSPPAASTSLSYPLPGWPIVSKYGMRMHPILGYVRMHEGIDIWAPMGTPIKSAGPGTVIWTGPRGGYGNAVFVDHGGGLATIYAHLSEIAVSTGQTVGRGQAVGAVGSTGLSTGPHLHFEVRINGTAYDPLRFVSP